ncbi:divergent polysaccharide deacetylase family protein [Epibacterium ulvae]|uniref:divergent polysaccharide deacetylase family protein n=1 Tax=Epibacterium ulvae TaxID=1156985 RepID=UPI0024901E0C|nr:divergent polysaccharide deacetylase family protein [Epibacterium ulvae]
MRGFLSGVSIGAVVAAIGATAVSLWVPLPLKLQVPPPPAGVPASSQTSSTAEQPNTPPREEPAITPRETVIAPESLAAPDAQDSAQTLDAPDDIAQITPETPDPSATDRVNQGEQKPKQLQATQPVPALKIANDNAVPPADLPVAVEPDGPVDENAPIPEFAGSPDLADLPVQAAEPQNSVSAPDLEAELTASQDAPARPPKVGEPVLENIAEGRLPDVSNSVVSPVGHTDDAQPAQLSVPAPAQTAELSTESAVSPPAAPAVPDEIALVAPAEGQEPQLLQDAESAAPVENARPSQLEPIVQGEPAAVVSKSAAPPPAAPAVPTERALATPTEGQEPLFAQESDVASPLKNTLPAQLEPITQGAPATVVSETAAPPSTQPETAPEPELRSDIAEIKPDLGYSTDPSTAEIDVTQPSPVAPAQSDVPNQNGLISNAAPNVTPVVREAVAPEAVGTPPSLPSEGVTPPVRNRPSLVERDFASANIQEGSTGIGRPGLTLITQGDPQAVENESDAEPVAPIDLPPFKANAEDFNLIDNRPLMSIVLIDDENAFGAEALTDFPYPLSFAINPEDPKATQKAAERRAAGFEVLMLVDLPQEATPQDAETALEVWGKEIPNALGVLEGVTTGFQGNRPLADQISAVVEARGLGMVMQNNGLNTVQKLAARNGVPASVVFRDFDGAGQDPRAIRRFLDQAAFRASQEGAVIMLGRLRADTISALLLWGLQDRASRVQLAPVSASLSAQQAEN